jgi:SPOR domain
MAHQGFTEAPSRRFIRAYLVIWAVGAVGALGYLATLAWQPEQLAPAVPPSKVVQANPGLEAATQALAEVGTIKQTVDSLQRNVGELKDSVEQRGDSDKTLQSRLAALEEKVAAIPSGGTPTSSVPMTNRQKLAEKSQQKAAATAPVTAKASPPKNGARVITITEDPAGTTPPPAAKAPIETGSITQPPVVFGEAVVTRAADLYAVQLDVAPSVDVLRHRWDLLLERYGATLAALQPRIVAPRTQGAPYRLVAGPLASAAEAKNVCGELQSQIPACTTTDFAGEPL